MQRIHLATALIVALAVTIAQGCRKDEPKPPNTPPPAESQRLS